MAPLPQYGSISHNDEDDDETTPLELSDGSISMPDKTRIRGRSFLFWSFATVVALVLVGGLHHWYSFTTTNDDKSSTADATFFLSPQDDMGYLAIDRVHDAGPSKLWGNKLGTTQPLPTNSWYLNLLSHRAANAPDESTKVYTYPYIIDTAPSDPLTGGGVRIHWPVMQASDRNMQMVYDAVNGLTLGTLQNVSHYTVDEDEDLSLLGVSLQWKGHEKSSMKTHVVRGMPFVTMRYSGDILPTLTSANRPAANPIVDGSDEITCDLLQEDGTVSTKSKGTTTHSVEKEILLQFKDSDFTWAVFFNRPVQFQCAAKEPLEISVPGAIGGVAMQLTVVDVNNDDEDDELVVRVALVNQCTTGKSDMTAHCTNSTKIANPDAYLETLREHVHLFPKTPKIRIDFPENDDDSSSVEFDWNVQSTLSEASSSTKRLRETSSEKEEELLMFALPHHQEIMLDDSTQVTEHCVSTFHGRACLVKGNKWLLKEDLGSPQSFLADRPPQAFAIPDLAAALSTDLQHQLSDNMLRGAADTYFSGKILARVGRVIILASELKDLAAGSSVYSDVTPQDYELAVEAASKETLPSDQDIEAAVDMLKRGVQIWLSDDAEAPFVYDRSWGGLVNCGCTYHGEGDKGVCNNTFPHCPALADVNIDFGNGYYNDHHFHYGYHIYAAAVAAKYDPDWGRQYFDRVLLYIRDIANASPDDSYFTPFRQKDWFLGSSWASGIVSAENSPHGRNQESSSEAIAAYEAIALYGQVMMDAFSKDSRKQHIAKQVRNVGQLLTVTEVRAANRYWHVWNGPNHNNTYPSEYQQPAVGMLYETMASFQTWFAPEAVVSYGIQLLPLTPVAEIRDDPYWASILYPLYKESCESETTFCVHNGWSIMEEGLLATIGKAEEALKQVLEIPSKVFETEGADGNSLSNTIWFVSTRKPVKSGTLAKSGNSTTSDSVRR